MTGHIAGTDTRDAVGARTEASNNRPATLTGLIEKRLGARIED